MANLIILSFFISTAIAQYQPEAENTRDLRENKIIFSIKDTKSKREIHLERSANQEHFLKDSQKDFPLKLPHEQAHKIDLEYSSLFLKWMYGDSVKFDNCENYYNLEMKGEQYKFCQLDKTKTKELKRFTQKLNKLK